MISSCIWRALPGNAVVKTVILLALTAGTVYALFEWGFPWVSEYLELQEQSVEA